MPIRVFFVEDHAVMRETVRDYLDLSPDMEMCGDAADAEAASRRLETANADVILVDLSLPGRSGLELLEEIKERWGTPCVILSGHGERTYVARAFAAGARGYVLKGRPLEVSAAIRRVMEGEIYLSEELRRKLDYEPELESGKESNGA